MKIFSIIIAIAIGIFPANETLAAGSGSPTTTEKSCKKKGMVFDKTKKKCIEASRGMFDDDTLFLSTRNLAYDGKFDQAIHLLQLAENQDDPRILNFLGFSNRKKGRLTIALSYYERALEIDPNYILARSYMGQGMVADGNMVGAKEQLAEIRDRGRADSWAYTMLENAIKTNVTY